MGSLMLKAPAANARTALDAAWARFTETTLQTHEDKLDALKDAIGKIVDSAADTNRMPIAVIAVSASVGALSGFVLGVLRVLEFLR